MAYKKIVKKEEEFEQKLIDVARVTRVQKGGKKMRFRTVLAIGDKKGNVGIGIAKGADVQLAVAKSFTRAKKNMIKVPLNKIGTIPHEIFYKFKAAKVLLKPASLGTGVKAGGAVRTILELAGVQNVTAKILGTNTKLNNVKATIEALNSFKIVKKKDNQTDSTKKSQEKKKDKEKKNS